MKNLFTVCVLFICTSYLLVQQTPSAYEKVHYYAKGMPSLDESAPSDSILPPPINTINKTAITHESDSPVTKRDDQALKKKENSWDSLDKSLDTSLAATLAGLAIAVATFLISATAPLAQEIRYIKSKEGTPSPKDMKRFKRMSSAVSQLMAAFYVFVGMLITTLTLDQWEEPGAWLSEHQWASSVDLGLTSGSLGVGLFLLGLGTKTLKKLIIEDPKTIRK